MGRTLITVVLLIAVTQAQVGILPVSRPEPVAIDPMSPRLSWITLFPEYGSLRRGTEEKVMVIPELNPMARGGTPTYWAPASPNNGALTATELTIAPMEGFTIRAIEYPKVRKAPIETDAGPVRVLGPDRIALQFKVRADSTVALGTHTLKAKLKFQRITRVGNSTPQELEFSIPIQVVEHSAKVARGEMYRPRLTPLQIVGLVVLIPLALPIGILMALGGWYGC